MKFGLFFFRISWSKISKAILDANIEDQISSLFIEYSSTPFIDKEPTNAQRTSTLDYKNLNHHEITLNDGSCQLFSFTLGVICVTSTSSIEHCPTVFYSHALFTWPYANEVQRTTFSDKVHWVWPSQCQSKMNTMKLEACSSTTTSTSSSTLKPTCYEMDLKNFHTTEMKLPSCQTFNIFLKPRQTLHQKAYKHLEYLWKSEVSTLPHLDMDSVTGYDHIKIIIDQVRKIFRTLKLYINFYFLEN